MKYIKICIDKHTSVWFWFWLFSICFITVIYSRFHMHWCSELLRHLSVYFCCCLFSPLRYRLFCILVLLFKLWTSSVHMYYAPCWCRTFKIMLFSNVKNNTIIEIMFIVFCSANKTGLFVFRLFIILAPVLG